MASEELAENKDLKAEVRRLKGDNEILRLAWIFFTGELDRVDRGVRRRDEGRGVRGQVDLQGAA